MLQQTALMNSGYVIAVVPNLWSAAGTGPQRENEKIKNRFCLINTNGLFILEILPLSFVHLPSAVQLTERSTSVKE